MSIGEGWAQQGLVAGYHLSDTTDFSGNNYHLTNTGTTTFVAGKFINCADFGTANSTKHLTYASNLGIDGGAITTDGWFKMRTEIGAGIYSLMSQSSTTTRTDYHMDYQYNAGTRNMIFARDRGGVVSENFTYTITLGTSAWYHIVLVYTGTTIIGYINGNTVGSVAASGTGTDAGTPNKIAIGAYSYNLSNFSSVYADECHFYNVAKSANWVRQQYALGRFGHQ